MQLLLFEQTMSDHIRKEQICQNCGNFVKDTFCGNCGQKNSDSRHAFWHLFTHFISDLFHYDNSFWTSLRVLLFKPGKLSEEYMDGKRKSQINPFSLYIFISFVAIFSAGFLPNSSKINDLIRENLSRVDTKKNFDNFLTNKIVKDSDGKEILPKDEYTKGEVVSILKFYKKDLEELSNFVNSLKQDGPKTLFILMPIFAFFLWFFYRKKRKYYFDSGIFTLHLFSYTFALFILFVALSKGIYTINPSWNHLSIVNFFLLAWIIYFLVACVKFYKDSWFKVILKSIFILFINALLYVFIFVGLIFFEGYFKTNLISSETENNRPVKNLDKKIKEEFSKDLQKTLKETKKDSLP